MEYTQKTSGMTCAEAVGNALKGDQNAFRFLYESTCRDKFYMARQYMKNDEDAADVLQESYLKAWQRLPTLTDAEKFPQWLSSIVARTALDALKKKQPVLFSDLSKEGGEGETFEYEEMDLRAEYQPEKAFTDQETSFLLKEMIDSLSDEQRMCVLMHYVEEIPVQEIADAANCSRNTVLSRLHYGRKNLRTKAEELEKKGYSLYGLAALPLFRSLLHSAASMQTEAASVMPPAFDGPVSMGTAALPPAAGSGGMALGVKIAIGLLAIAVAGGGGYAAIKTLRGSQNASEEVSYAVEADTETEDVAGIFPGDTVGEYPEDLKVNPVFDRLDPEVQELFLAQIAWAEEETLNRSWAWIYFDDDDFPELLVREMNWRGEEDRGFLYYGTTASELIEADDGFVVTLPESGTGNDVLYYVPHQGIFMHDAIVDSGIGMEGVVPDIERALATGVYAMEEPGTIKFQYNLFRDVSNEEENRYYMLPAGSKIQDLVILRPEEYRRLHYDGEKIPFLP